MKLSTGVGHVDLAPDDLEHHVALGQDACQDATRGNEQAIGARALDGRDAGADGGAAVDDDGLAAHDHANALASQIAACKRSRCRPHGGTRSSAGAETAARAHSTDTTPDRRRGPRRYHRPMTTIAVVADDLIWASRLTDAVRRAGAQPRRMGGAAIATHPTAVAVDDEAAAIAGCDGAIVDTALMTADPIASSAVSTRPGCQSWPSRTMMTSGCANAPWPPARARSSPIASCTMTALR